MIYQIKDNKKIPLGTQFDNSWEIEYDRNLASQLSGKTEWTATEDCWFQYNGIWVRNKGDADSDKIRNVKITVNGVEIQTRDSSGAYTTTAGVDVVLYGASVLLKKGDVVAIRNDLGTTFDLTSAKVFPIHRILSKEKEVETNLPVKVPATYSVSSGNIYYTLDLSDAFSKMKIGDTILVTLRSNTTLRKVLAIISVNRAWNNGFSSFTPVYLSEYMYYEGSDNTSLKFRSPGTNNGEVYCTYIKI